MMKISHDREAVIWLAYWDTNGTDAFVRNAGIPAMKNMTGISAQGSAGNAGRNVSRNIIGMKAEFAQSAMRSSTS